MECVHSVNSHGLEAEPGPHRLLSYMLLASTELVTFYSYKATSGSPSYHRGAVCIGDGYAAVVLICQCTAETIAVCLRRFEIGGDDDFQKGSALPELYLC